MHEILKYNQKSKKIEYILINYSLISLIVSSLTAYVDVFSVSISISLYPYLILALPLQQHLPIHIPAHKPTINVIISDPIPIIIKFLYVYNTCDI